MDAYGFWKRVDENNPCTTLKSLMEECGIEYNRTRRNRADMRLPNAEDLYLISVRERVSMEYLLTGERSGHNYSARVCAIADLLMQNQDKLGAVEVLLFGKNAGASSEFTKREA